MNKHVAIKCNYNNGDEGLLVGFNGTCSDDIIEENTQKYVWCKQPQCPCKKYVDSNFKGKRPELPCMESRLFKDWYFGAGTYHNGPDKGKSKTARLAEGGICFLTTRFSNDKEIDRKIIGLYRIGKVTNSKDGETLFYADYVNRIRLPLEEAKELSFWDYYSNKNNSQFWGSGLHRFLTDEQVKNILLDLNDTIQSVQHKEVINNLLDSLKQVKISNRGKSKNSNSRKKRIAVKRKYGGGGEGDNHRELKEWVAENPNLIGLSNVTKHELEHVFISGDAVDILFELSDGNDVVVEIETTVPLPGCHQAIKYRALRCAERNLSLQSKKIKAVLVAWEISQEVKKFCNSYNILYYEIKK